MLALRTSSVAQLAIARMGQRNEYFNRLLSVVPGQNRNSRECKKPFGSNQRKRTLTFHQQWRSASALFLGRSWIAGDGSLADSPVMGLTAGLQMPSPTIRGQGEADWADDQGYGEQSQEKSPPQEFSRYWKIGAPTGDRERRDWWAKWALAATRCWGPRVTVRAFSCAPLGA